MLSFALIAILALLAPAHARSADLSKAEEIAVRNAIDDALNQVRDIILNGDPENGIPVLDPLVVDNYEFNVDEEPTVVAEGSVSDARLEGLGAFVVTASKISITVLPPRATVTVGINVPAVSANGNYKLTGDAHLDDARSDLHVEGDGDFTVVVKDISVNAKVVVSVTSLSVRSVDVTLGLGDVFIEVNGAGEASELINSEAAARIEQYFNDNRSELEKLAADIITEVINSALGKRMLN